MSWATARSGAQPTTSASRPAASPSSPSPSPSPSAASSASRSPGTAGSPSASLSHSGGSWGTAAQPRAQGAAAPSSTPPAASPVSPRGPPVPKAGGWAQAHVARAPQTQTQTTQEELRNVDATTARMLQRLEVTEDLADATLNELDEQNAKIRGAQDDLAEVHDDLDTSARKLAGIKSFWGVAWGKKKHEHRNAKERAEYEKEMAKLAMKDERVRQQSEKKSDAAAQQSHLGQLNRALDDPALHKDLRRTEKADRKQPPQQQQVSSEPMRFEADGFFFEEREDARGEQAQAEQDLEKVHEHVQSLKGKAWTMGQRVDESSKRLENVQAEVDRADQRTNKNIQRGNKIIG